MTGFWEFVLPFFGGMIAGGAGTILLLYIAFDRFRDAARRA
jgi:hypothetical protein